MFSLQFPKQMLGSVLCTLFWVVAKSRFHQAGNATFRRAHTEHTLEIWTQKTRIKQTRVKGGCVFQTKSAMRNISFVSKRKLCLSFKWPRKNCRKKVSSKFLSFIADENVNGFVSSDSDSNDTKAHVRISYLINYLFCNFFHWSHTGSVEVVIVLTGLYKKVILNVFFHLLARSDEVVVPAILFIFPPRSRCICKSEKIQWRHRYISCWFQLVTVSVRQGSFILLPWRCKPPPPLPKIPISGDLVKKTGKEKLKVERRNLRGTQLPNLSGNSEMRSSLIRSLSGPRMITGLVYFTAKTQRAQLKPGCSRCHCTLARLAIVFHTLICSGTSLVTSLLSQRKGRAPHVVGSGGGSRVEGDPG